MVVIFLVENLLGEEIRPVDEHGPHCCGFSEQQKTYKIFIK